MNLRRRLQSLLRLGADNEVDIRSDGLSMSEAEPALLSVIVPVYNVEKYLRAAIRSISQQSYEALEVILVNDGSTDSSGEICDEIAADDERIRVIHQLNGGLGNARNVGVANAGGRFLTFLDSDDLVSPGAYEVMISSLMKTGSEVATGNVERFNSTKSWPSWNQQRSHIADQLAVSLGEWPALIYDSTAPNKIFRRDFYDRVGLSFEVGKLFEDVVPMLRAYLAAGSIDIVADTVYRWRERDEKDSITQSRQELRNLNDRVEMLDRGRELLSGQQIFLDQFDLKIFEGDLFWYRRHVATGDVEFDASYLAAIKKLWPRRASEVLRGVRFERRVFFATAIDYGLEAALDSWQWCKDHKDELVGKLVDGRLYADPACSGAAVSTLPLFAWELHEEARAEVKVRDLHWIEQKLRLRGTYSLPYADPSRDVDLEIDAFDSGGNRLALVVTSTGTEFEAWLDAEDVWEKLPGETIELQASVSHGDLKQSMPVADVSRRGSFHGLAALSMDSWRRIEVSGWRGQPLSLRKAYARARARDVKLTNRTLSVVVETIPDLRVTAATLVGAGSLADVSVDVQEEDAHLYLLAVDVPEPGKAGHLTRRLRLSLDDGSFCFVEMGSSSAVMAEGDNGALWVLHSRDGRFAVLDSPRLVEIDAAQLSRNSVRLSGHAAPGTPLQFGCAGDGKQPASWVEARRDGRDFDVTLELPSTLLDPLLDDERFVVAVRSSSDEFADWVVRVSIAGARPFPLRLEDGELRLEAYVVKDKSIRLRRLRASEQ